MTDARFLQTLQKTRCILPPLTGYTDYPYRVILSSFHPGFITTEMVHTSPVVRRNRRTMQMLRRTDGGHLNGAQLLGRDPPEMVAAAKLLVNEGFDFIDVNMGCTSPKVTRRGEGVALMLDEQHAANLVSALVQTIDVPVTVKIRLGPTPTLQNYLSLALRLQEAGATAITIHGRTGDHKTSPSVNHSCIAQAVSALSIPVIANGGVSSGKVARAVVKKTGCAGIMPGRFLIGNPWLVQEIQAALEGNLYHPPGFEERRDVCRQHFGHLTEMYGPWGAAIRLRSIFSHYFPKIKNRAAFNKDVHLMDYSQFLHLLDAIEDSPWESQRIIIG